MSKKIKITASGPKDAASLTGCYFLPTNTPGSYVLFGKNDDPIVTTPMPVTNNSSFSFKILSTDSYSWQIPNPATGSEQFSINNDTASGSWWNGDPTVDNEESGTFTATASGGVDEDEESASSATA